MRLAACSGRIMISLSGMPPKTGYTGDPPPGLGIRGILPGCKPDKEVCGGVESVVRESRPPGLLGHRSMDMTLTYARISDHTVAEEYFRVTEAVEANYRRMDPTTACSGRAGTPKPPADHRRLLANGHCTRPALLDCVFESVCERCGFFETGPKFIPILKRQRNHAEERDRNGRVELFNGLIDGVAEAP
jgi:hypothetical protein